jgi:PTH1 family peptidyl-tRNA hydrolase
MTGPLSPHRVIIAGLGNPGARYDSTRHNWGFIVVDALARRANISLDREKFHAHIGTGEVLAQPVLLLKPQTFMNRSGLSVSAAAKLYQSPPASWLVIHDDLDLKPGAVRLKVGGGHGGHNGLRSIIADTGQASFPRLRIGIGRSPHGQDPADWVLSRFSPPEQAALSQITDDAVDAILSFLSLGAAAAQNTINARTPPTIF